MSVDYYINFPCKVREQVSDEDLLRMEKARNRAQFVLEMMRKDGTKRDTPESEWTVTIKVLGPNGPEMTEAKISDMFAEAAPLDALAVHCPGCPANLRNAAFGCGGAIHYPIERATEEWLLARLPDDISSPTGRLLMDALKEFGFDGKAIDAARARKELYVSDTPVKRTWGNWLSKKAIASSQVLQFLVGVGHLQPAHAKMAAVFFGFNDVSPDKPTTVSFENSPHPDDIDGVAEFKMFLNAASFAGVHGFELLIDA
jgi:hypothetical protein